MLVDPCVPKDWKGFTVTRKWRGATFEITVKNPNGVSRGVKSITLNNEPIAGTIPVQPEGTVNKVEVLMA